MNTKQTILLETNTMYDSGTDVTRARRANGQSSWPPSWTHDKNRS